MTAYPELNCAWQDMLEAQSLYRAMEFWPAQRKKDGAVGVLEPALGDFYLEMLPDYALVERSTIPFGYRTIDNFRSELLLLY